MNNRILAFFNCFTYMSLAAFNAQLIPFLVDQGYPPIQRGILLGVSALLTFVLAYIVGKIMDETQAIKACFLVCLSSYSIVLWMTLYSSSVWLQALSFLLMVASIRMLMSLTETITFQLKKDFGKFHCMSALGLVIGSLIGGYFFQENQKIFVLFTMLCVAISFGLVIKMKIKLEKKPKVEHAIKKILKNKNYVLLLIILFFLMVIGYADQFVVVEKLIQLDYQAYIRIKFAIQASMEIPLYYFSKPLLEKFKAIDLLVFASVMSGVKFLLYGAVNHIVWILIVSLLQVVTHPIIVLTSKKLIQKISDPKLASTTQMVGFAVYMGFSGFVSPIMGNILIENIGTTITLFIYASLAIVPFFLLRRLKCVTLKGEGETDENLLN